MNRAVVYYSLTGNGKEIAEKLSQRLSADLFSIDVVKPMPNSFTKQILVGGMQATFGLKPAIQPVPPQVFEKEDLILVFPVWAGKHAPAMNTFIHMDGIAEKVSGVVLVSGGGKNEKCVPGLKKKLPNIKHWIELYDEPPLPCGA